MVNDEGPTRAGAAPAGQVRRASEGDWSGLADLRWSWRVQEQAEVGMTRAEFSSAFAGWLHNHLDTHTAFVAQVDTSTVGMAWLATVERVPGPGLFPRVAGTLQSVYVLPHHRERGLGAALVTAALDEACQRRFDYVSVHPSERSSPLYTRLGFRQTGRVLEINLWPRYQSA